MENFVEVDAKKEKQRAMFRRMALHHQIRNGQNSLQTAFAIWKECGLLVKRVQRARELTE